LFRLGVSSRARVSRPAPPSELDRRESQVCGPVVEGGCQPETAGAWLWFGVNDADVLCDEYTAAGATIGLPPTNYPGRMSSMCRTPTGTSCVTEKATQ